MYSHSACFACRVDRSESHPGKPKKHYLPSSGLYVFSIFSMVQSLGFLFFYFRFLLEQLIGLSVCQLFYFRFVNVLFVLFNWNR